MAKTAEKRERTRNEEIEQILDRAGMTQTDAAAYLSNKLGREVRAYHISRTVNGERAPTVDEMDALRELGRRFLNKGETSSTVAIAPRLTDAGDFVPLFGANNASSDAPLRLTEEFRIGVVPIHPAQRGSKAALAFVMYDETLGDRLRHGDIGYAIRGWQPIVGHPCVVERNDGDVVVKIYEGRDANTVFLSQLKPAKKVHIARREVFAVHPVVGTTYGPG